MRDGLGREVDYLRLSVTGACNLRCVYCRPAAGAGEGGSGGVADAAAGAPLSADELVRIAAAFARLGVRKVRITGGEPLVRSDVVDIVARLRAIPGVDELALTTNGTLLAPLAAPLRAAGLDRVNVSLDTLDPARYAKITRGGRIDDALQGLEAAERAGFQGVKINCVLVGGMNDDEVPALAGIARDHAVDVRFIELMPVGPAAGWPAERFVPAEAVLEAVPELAPAGSDGVAEVYTVSGWAGRVGLIRPLSHPFCASCSRVRVTADGNLKTCLAAAEEVPLAGLADPELERAILGAVERKPARHIMDAAHASQSPRGMETIGG